MKKIIFILHIFAFSALSVFAQPGTGGTIVDPNAQPEFLKAKDEWQQGLRPDGVIDKVPHRAYVTPHAAIRENDVLWRKRLWRMIDTRQKQNRAFRYNGEDDEAGGGYFIEILLNAIKKGEVQAFDNDRFTSPIDYDAVYSRIAPPNDTIPITGSQGQDSIVVIQRGFEPTNFTKFKVKEDVIFDRVLGRAVTRIVAIAPVMDKYDPETNVYRGQTTAFWLYYPETRPTLAKYLVYNEDNDVFRISWDDYFEQHKFASYIYKSSNGNIGNEDISQYKKGVDKMYESERIKNELFNKEHDLWVY
jgi:gliding motility associated protien GldN